MSGPPRRFDPSELRTPGVTEPSAAELADALGAARELEALAASEGIRPTEGFEDRVMAAIALEPAPRAVVSGGSASAATGPAAFLFAFRNAWRVATTGGRPFAVRAQALAFVLVVLLAAGTLAGAGAIAVAGLFNGNDAPAPSVQPLPTALPTPDVPGDPVALRRPPIADRRRRPPSRPRPPNRPRPTETARPTKRRGRAKHPNPPTTTAAAGAGSGGRRVRR